MTEKDPIIFQQNECIVYLNPQETDVWKMSHIKETDQYLIQNNVKKFRIFINL